MSILFHPFIKSLKTQIDNETKNISDRYFYCSINIISSDWIPQWFREWNINVSRPFVFLFLTHPRVFVLLHQIQCFKNSIWERFSTIIRTLFSTSKAMQINDAKAHWKEVFFIVIIHFNSENARHSCNIVLLL